MENLKQEILKIKELKHLFIEESEYKWFFIKKSRKTTHLHKIVVKTRKYPILNEYIKFYLKDNPNEVDKMNDIGSTALIIAARKSKNDSSEETVKILLEHGANVNLQEDNGSTALMDAVMYSKIDSS